MDIKRLLITLAMYWVAASALALGTWSGAPGVQHVLQFMVGAVWAVMLVVVFVAARTQAGRKTPMWAVALTGAPVGVIIMFSIAITWEVFSPAAIALSTPLRIVEVAIAWFLGHIGKRTSAGGAVI